ncbi:MAG: PQQ-dependent catabolism-associated CXXCW motif protein [Candidatus Thiodiazotropha sp. (ex Lucinoma kastoroae)]|nr:PQQ-dependent catabolism-associated CXXCW motif protein [Candidatus Thiodiazotropha sp. (ex Lucinoma kastoroae)]MCU7859713.1 PQQ-dependent catabolism-associated CXXCW motif protein [Candidatus Thiodiazotropha sp. (ex Lucinoma kastoroae)]
MNPQSPMYGSIHIDRSLAGRVTLICILILFATYITAKENTERFSSDGYRITDFRSPVPDTVPSGFTVTTQQVQKLLQDDDVILIDVLPAPIKPKDRPSGLLWLPPARHNIPGSVWLPNVGYGALSDELEAYFKVNLAKYSAGDKSRKIIIYCQADCWMSWNAAKRAATCFGYTQIYWYPDGTTGWEAAGLSQEKSMAVPMDVK